MLTPQQVVRLATICPGFWFLISETEIVGDFVDQDSGIRIQESGRWQRDSCSC